MRLRDGGSALRVSARTLALSTVLGGPCGPHALLGTTADCTDRSRSRSPARGAPSAPPPEDYPAISSDSDGDILVWPEWIGSLWTVEFAEIAPDGQETWYLRHRAPGNQVMCAVVRVVRLHLAVPPTGEDRPGL